MTETVQRGPADQPEGRVTALRSELQPGLDIARVVSDYSQESKANEKQYGRAKQAANAASRTAAATVIGTGSSRRMQAHYAQYKPAGYHGPPGLRGVKFRLVGKGAYRGYLILTQLNGLRLWTCRLRQHG